MQQITLRRAVREDCPTLLAMVRELAEFERAPHEVTVTLEHFTESGFGPQPVWWAFVAEENGTIQGFALYYIRFSTWKGQRLYLEDIYIRPEKRGQGIGTQLFDALVQEMRERHLHGMVWQALEWNTAALNFYRKYNARFDTEWVNCSIEGNKRNTGNPIVV